MKMIYHTLVLFLLSVNTLAHGKVISKFFLAQLITVDVVLCITTKVKNVSVKCSFTFVESSNINKYVVMPIASDKKLL